MKYLILADIRDNLGNLREVFLTAQRSEAREIIFCGNILRPSTLVHLAAFPGKIHFLFGEEDRNHEEILTAIDERYRNIVFYGDTFGTIKAGYFRIAFTPRKGTAQVLAHDEVYDFVFYGDPFRVGRFKLGPTMLVNPGSLSGGIDFASAALWDSLTGEVRFITLPRRTDSSLTRLKSSVVETA
ncbi:MAG: metallophosphoesterase family protein [Parcubacteria group bacterium]|nr:metallophosphoesterase family protein [Parcubacteria group bacterium]